MLCSLLVVYFKKGQVCFGEVDHESITPLVPDRAYVVEGVKYLCT